MTFIVFRFDTGDSTKYFTTSRDILYNIINFSVYVMTSQVTSLGQLICYNALILMPKYLG